jgi:hypothetical protein
MENLNLYWPVYKNLENEVLKLANILHFTDDQLKVYSIHIADLIVRASIEIEAISKELYVQLGGDMLIEDENGNKKDIYFDTDCIKLLNEKWKICQKEIVVSASNFYFTKNEIRKIKPLHKADKRGSSGSSWKKAYQGVKHDRKNELKKATIENLLYAMGALYILNIYFKNEKIDVGRVYLNDKEFDNRVGSEMFSVSYYNATGFSFSENLDDSCIVLGNQDLDKSVYIVKYDDSSFKQLRRDMRNDLEESKKKFASHPDILKYLEDHPESNDKSMNEICIEVGGIPLLAKTLLFENMQKNKTGRHEAVLNKNTGKIYDGE